ncbi:UPF0481 protein At3g47200-like [Quercus robur]|uniref:UPF0481 protein At3g47200-like n=1 Tax=Quercus robur TaxID=38942 RepID=UPI00216387E9|nr:UPF0481 protein At3g47200-like [Quercus robur]
MEEEIQPATASINNEDQNTQKEANISGRNENKNDKLVIEIREMVERPEIQSSKRCRIYRVPHHLRKFNEEAYSPQIISIGPFHHQTKRLKAMEEHKERFFRSFVKRSKINLECLVGTIKEMEESIRGCYEETINLNSDRFVKMILVDASFILELLFRDSSEKTEDHLVGVLGEPRASAVMLDLLLLENQLPFFVIEKLHQLAFPSLSDAYPGFSNYDALLKLSINYFRDSYDFQFRHDLPNVEIDHFTDLLRTVQLPPPKKQPKRRYQQIRLFYTATQLHEAGVKFEVGTSECCFDIKFEKGVLKIPMLELNDWTEVATRNIMALEQTSYIKNAYFTDYFLLMDSLINTRKDVDLLCDKKILVNCLGDNDAAKSMVNNLNKGIIWVTKRDDYIDLYNELNSFYDKPWHSWKATLKRQYFSTPWRAASTVAAIILLVLTFIQTACSIIPVA